MKAIIFVVTISDIALLVVIALTILVIIGHVIHGWILDIRDRRRSKKFNDEKFPKKSNGQVVKEEDIL